MALKRTRRLALCFNPRSRGGSDGADFDANSLS